MNIAVTGTTGFLGKHLTKDMRRRRLKFTILDRKKHNLFEPKSLRSLVANKDIIIHLAAANRDSDFNLIKVNTLGTIGLLTAIKDYSPSAKVIFSSSWKTLLSDSTYGQSKRFAEQLIKLYTRKYQIKALILRISNIFGPECKPFYNSVIATFLEQIKQGKELTVNGDGSQKRDFIYVDDVVNAIFQAIKYRPARKFECLNICSGKMTSLDEIIDILQTLISKDIKVSYNKQIETEKKYTFQNYAEDRKKLNWQPKVSLKEGLQKIVKHQL